MNYTRVFKRAKPVETHATLEVKVSPDAVVLTGLLTDDGRLELVGWVAKGVAGGLDVPAPSYAYRSRNIEQSATQESFKRYSKNVVFFSNQNLGVE